MGSRGTDHPRAGASPTAVLAAIAASLFWGASAAHAREQEAVASGSETGVEVSVPYVTNRRREAPVAEQKAYGGDRGATSFGRCSAVFTTIPVINQIAPRVPFYLADETLDLRIEPQTDPGVFLRQLQEQRDCASIQSPQTKGREWSVRAQYRTRDASLASKFGIGGKLSRPEKLLVAPAA